MTAQFEVETGASSATATSYASVAQYKQYWLDRGTTIADSDASIQAWLNLATEYIDMTYTFEGDRTDINQALEWPRLGATKNSSYQVLSDSIPAEVINATCWVAARAKVENLNPVDYGIKSQSIGPVSKTFSKSSTARTYPIVEKLLRYFIVTGSKLVRVN